MRADRQTSKRHRRLIRTITGAGFADLVGIGGMGRAVGSICVETTVRDSDDQYAVTISVDPAGSRPGPGEVYSLSSLHLVTARAERYLALV